MQPGHRFGQLAGAREFGQQSLRLAECIAVQHGGFAARRAPPPPVDDAGNHLGGVGPAVDRKGKGRLRQETVASQRYERGAGRIRLPLVVAGHDPATAVHLDAYLRRAQDVPGRMQRHACPPQDELLAVAVRIDGAFAEPPAQQLEPIGGRVAAAVARARMVAVCVREHGRADRLQRIDEEVAGRAVQPLGTKFDGRPHARPARGRACRRCPCPARIRRARAGRRAARCCQVSPPRCRAR